MRFSFLNHPELHIGRFLSASRSRSYKLVNVEIQSGFHSTM